jgi:hypothetical protein
MTAVLGAFLVSGRASEKATVAPSSTSLSVPFRARPLFQSFNEHDTFAGDDLHARLALGSATPEVADDGPEDGNLAFVSAPLVRLAWTSP